MANWMGLRAYARYRGDSLAGVQKAIATSRISAEAVRRDERGRCVGIEQARADRDWAINTDPAEALRNRKNPAALLPPNENTSRSGAMPVAPPELASGTDSAVPADLLGSAPAEGDLGGGVGGGAPAEGDLGGGGGGGETAAAGRGAKDDPFGYQQARARREEIERALKQLDLLERRGALVRASEVERAAAETARQVRNAVLAIPDRLAPVLDPSNPGRAHKLLTDELQKALRELTDGLDERVAAAAGARERELALP
jgi:hypothetical protein